MELKKQVKVAAPVAEVWKCWTTKEGLLSFFALEVRLEPKVGGAFEMLFLSDAPEGSKGSEGCKILAMEEPGKLAFSWNFPPTLPEIRNEHTRVDLSFTPIANDETMVEFVQRGWKTGGEWDEGYRYFDKAWDMVLNNLVKCFE